MIRNPRETLIDILAHEPGVPVLSVMQALAVVRAGLERHERTRSLRESTLNLKPEEA